MNNTLTMNSGIDNKNKENITCQQYFNLNETTYIPDIYEFKQQPILVLTDQRHLQTITSLSNSTLQITQSSQISVEDQEHQISSRGSDLESINSDNNFHRNYNKINDITKLSLIPILPNNSINNTKNLWLLQKSSDNLVINSNIKRHFKRRVANHHNSHRPICYSQNIKSNIKNKFGYNSFSAPSSLISSAIATTCSKLQSEKIKENEQMNYQQLQLLLPTLSTVNLTNDDIHDDHDHENCLNRKFLNDFDIALNENSIVVTEPVQITDRSFSNQSITNDHKVNLLTSSECLSSSLENQKLDDLQHYTILNNSSYINLDNGNFPIRSHSFFHLRRLDSLSSTGSHSKPDTDILYPMNGSFNQLAIRVSSSPMSICSNNILYQHNNCSEDQYNKTTFGGNNYGGSSIKSRRSKCEKYINPDKHTCIRSHSAMRHPNECNARVFRSPLDVLSPCKGKLLLDIEYQNHSIKLHVIEAKGLRTTNNQNCNSFVKISATPDKGVTFEQTTEIIENSATPCYNKEFLLNLNKIKYCKRIHLAIYAQLTKELDCEFLGGMSFGIPSIQNKKHISGWYYLLDEKMFKKKHLKTALDPITNFENVLYATNELIVSDIMKTEAVTDAVTTNTSTTNQQIPIILTSINEHVTHRRTNEIHPNINRNFASNNQNINNYCSQEFRPVLSPTNFMIYSQNLPNTLLPYQISNPPVNSHLPQFSSPVPIRSNISFPNTNKALSNMRIFQFLIQKGSKGYGFTLCGNCPVYVSHVEPGSPAMQCGIQAGDFIVAIDNINVSRSTSNSVVRMFRMSQHPVHITISRPVLIKPSMSTTSNTHSTSSRSLGNLINKTCFSAHKKLSKESTKLIQPTNISKVSRTEFFSSLPYHQHPYDISSLPSSSFITVPLTSSSFIDCLKLSSYPNLSNLHQNSSPTICSSINHCIIPKFSIPQSISLHQTMNERLARIHQENSQSDSILSPYQNNPHHNQEEQPQQQRQQQQQINVNDIALVTIPYNGNYTKSNKFP
ncbi:unnamed protein product [Schistosoma spindalis]|nr:unnamed protein product [Schistosoma spindale]